MQITQRLAAATFALLVTALVGACSSGSGATTDTAPKSEPVAGVSAAATPAEATPSAAATTASPEAAPSAEPADPAVTQIDGTTWTGRDNDGATRTFEFMAGGQFATSENSTRYSNPSSTWTQTGNRFSAEFISGTSGEGSSYTGTIEGDTITGNGSNTLGAQWTFTVTQG